LYVWVDGQLAFYDAIHGSLVRTPMPKGDFRFVADGKGLDFSFNFSNRETSRDRMRIDVRSLMAGRQLHADAREGKGRYLLGYVTDAGTACAAAIDERSPTPCTHVEVSTQMPVGSSCWTRFT
jgi:hypothetical protein